MFFSTEELAKRVGVTRITVFRWIKSGKLKAEKIGRSFAIHENEANKLIGSGASKNKSHDCPPQ